MATETGHQGVQVVMEPDWVTLERRGTGGRCSNTDGRLLASLPAPPRRHLPPAIGTDHVLTVRRGDFDLEYVDVWRIDRGGAR